MYVCEELPEVELRARGTDLARGRAKKSDGLADERRAPGEARAPIDRVRECSGDPVVVLGRRDQDTVGVPKLRLECLHSRRVTFGLDVRVEEWQVSNLDDVDLHSLRGEFARRVEQRAVEGGAPKAAGKSRDPKLGAGQIAHALDGLICHGLDSRVSHHRGGHPPWPTEHDGPPRDAWTRHGSHPASAPSRRAQRTSCTPRYVQPRPGLPREGARRRDSARFGSLSARTSIQPGSSSRASVRAGVRAAVPIRCSTQDTEHDVFTSGVGRHRLSLARVPDQWAEYTISPPVTANAPRMTPAGPAMPCPRPRAATPRDDGSEHC